MHLLDNLTLAAAVGFGGRVSATITGVLHRNIASSLIVATDSSKIQLTDAWFSQNMGFIGTGVLIVGASTLHVINSTAGNLAVTFGGAIVAGSGTVLKIVDSAVQRTLLAVLRATLQPEGEGCFLSGSCRTEVKDTSFSMNCATGGVKYGQRFGLLADEGRGGAVWAVDSKFTSMTNTTFKFNTATAGGAISSVAGALTLDGCWFQKNLAFKYGGAVIIWKGLAHIVHGTSFLNNTAQVMPYPVVVKHNLGVGDQHLRLSCHGEVEMAILCRQFLV